MIENADKQKQARLPHEAYLKHFIEESGQEVPLWAYVDLLTVADISKLYKASSCEIKVAVADIMGLKIRSGAELMEKFMHSITILRNLCAHGSRLFNRVFEQKPRLSKSEFALLAENRDGEKDNAHLYSYLFVMRKLLKKEEFLAMKQEIIGMTHRYPFVGMRYYGFRSDWMEVL